MDCTGLHCIVGLGKDEAFQPCIFFCLSLHLFPFFTFLSYRGQGCVKIEHDSGSLNGLRGLVTRVLGKFSLGEGQPAIECYVCTYDMIRVMRHALYTSTALDCTGPGWTESPCRLTGPVWTVYCV